MAQSPSNTNIFLRLPAVKQKISLSKSAIYQKLDPNSKYYDPSFPVPVKIGARAIAFSSLQLQVWINSKLNGEVV
jgi:prophage regulatory protein